MSLKCDHQQLTRPSDISLPTLKVFLSFFFLFFFVVLFRYQGPLSKFEM